MPGELRVEFREFALELAIALPALRGEPSVGECCLHGAARLALVATVREPALGLERGYVLERLFEPVGSDPEVQLSHARVVYDQPATREDDELSPSGGMPA